MQTISRRQTAPEAAPARQPVGSGVNPLLLYAEYALGAVIVIGVMVSIWAALLYAPTDAFQGDIQRIMYMHVPVAWVAFLAFFVVLVASVLYLWRGDERWDALARASAELGVVFTTLALITGSIWGRPAWGAWWVWDDPKLTTTLVLWFIYAGYVLLRFYTGRDASSARNAAVLGIIGFVDVPIVYFAASWWRSIHPSLVVGPEGNGNIAPQMLVALMISVVTITLLFAFLLLQKYRIERLRSAVYQLRVRAELERAD
jgi:heme exporter protein C